MENPDPLRAPKLDLQAAERAITKMKKAASRDEFEEEWRDFLGCLEKVWVKTERCCQPFRSKFEPWQGKYTKLRRKDMLVRYLKHARDADNHSIQELVDVTPGSQSIKAGPSGVVHIRSMRIGPNGIEHLDMDGDAVLETTPPKVVAVRVLEHGEWYNPPTSHLGKPVKDAHPVTLAELGFEFYRNFLDETDQKFFGW